MLCGFEMDLQWVSLADCLLSNSTVQVLHYRKLNNAFQADRKILICLV